MNERTKVRLLYGIIIILVIVVIILLLVVFQQDNGVTQSNGDVIIQLGPEA